MAVGPRGRSLGLDALELRAVIGGSAFRWRLAGVELWRGLDCVGVLSADAVRHLIEHHLATAALQAAVAADLAAGPEGLRVTLDRLRKPLARASPALPGAALRSQRRLARRSRGSSRGA